MLIWLLMAAAAAQPTINCKNAMTTADMLYCANRDYRAADAAMTKAYGAAQAVMVSRDMGRDKLYDKRPGYSQALLASQRAWLRYRDAHCVTEGYSARGGSMEPLLVVGCVQELTEGRTKQLRDLVKLYND